MTPHKYPPLPTAQRDDTDRIGEILDTVRRIETRDAASPSSPRGRIFAEVVAERERQEAKFPGQRLPLVEPDDEPGRVDMPRTVDRLRNREAVAREVCESRAKYGSLTWLGVLNEEVAEALHSLAKMQAGIGGKEAARAELIQVAAVCFRILESEHFAEDNVVAEGGYTKG